MSLGLEGLKLHGGNLCSEVPPETLQSKGKYVPSTTCSTGKGCTQGLTLVVGL